MLKYITISIATLVGCTTPQKLKAVEVPPSCESVVRSWENAQSAAGREFKGMEAPVPGTVIATFADHKTGTAYGLLLASPNAFAPQAGNSTFTFKTHCMYQNAKFSVFEGSTKVPAEQI